MNYGVSVRAELKICAFCVYFPPTIKVTNIKKNNFFDPCFFKVANLTYKNFGKTKKKDGCFFEKIINT
jgi:hypothetical protein